MNEQNTAKLRKKFEKLYLARHPSNSLVRESMNPELYVDERTELQWQGFLMMADSLKPIKFKKNTYGEPCDWGGSSVIVVTVAEVKRWADSNAPFVGEFLPSVK